MHEQILPQFDKNCSQCCCKYFRRTCGIFVLVCVVSLASCVYCTVVLNTIRDLNLSCKSMQGNKQTSDGDKNSAVISHTGEKVAHGRPDDGRYNIYNVLPRNKRSDGKKNRKSKILVGHYETNEIAEYLRNISSYTKDRKSKTCMYVEDVRGTLCKTGDFKSETNTLHIFSRGSFSKPKSSPFKNIKDGKFVVRKKGIYLVYVQVLFYDNHEYQEILVKQWNKNNRVIKEHSCVRSLPGVEKNANNTCSITVLFFMNKGDFLTVELFNTDLTLNLLQQKSNFFGAILLR